MSSLKYDSVALPAVVWVTGLSAAGKTTICDAMWRQMKPALPNLVRIDGDVVRDVFGSDLGYAEADRVKQIKRLQSLTKMLNSQGMTVLVAALYSHPDLLAWNRKTFNRYFEVYLDANLDIVRQRDPKGIYARAFSGQEKNVVGVDIKWWPPAAPDLTVQVSQDNVPEKIAADIIDRLNLLGVRR